ncbi:ABC transporter permease [Schaalia sp. ZJ405]|uniref:ABC transporter permease n=1 Tax=Schaalia sp. ZJ405 TaxID=2709403 RepID=UPI0013EB9B6F|nr:ABC transporter permease [Schaalia sp. ZJ405]QPK81921.1 ABC transporter permease [Schaalia sp. ZJ405]
MKAMVVKEFRELVRDRRTVALLLVIPLLLLVVFGYAANFAVDQTRVIIAGEDAARVEQTLANNEEAREHLEIVRTDPKLTSAQVEEVLRRGEADAVITTSHSTDDAVLASDTHLWVDGSRLFAAQSAQGQWMKVLASDVRSHVSQIRQDMDAARADATQARENIDDIRTKVTDLRQALTQLRTNPSARVELPDLDALPDVPSIPELPDTSGLDLDALNQDQVVTVVFNPDLKTSWVMVPGLIGLILTFVGTVVTSIGLVRERETGTLEQLAVMPLRPSAIIAGKIAPYFLLSLIDAGIITTAAVWLFDVPFTGAIWRFSFLALVFVFVVLGMGVLISVVSQNTGQAVQMAIMMVMPQVLLSGLVFPLESMSAGVRWIGYLLPLTWFNQAANGIMLKAATLSELSLPVGILVLQAVLIFTLASVRMGRLLRHGGATK